MHRAYSLVTVKGFDPEQRTFSGIATSPVPDRLGDTIDSKGVKYKNPLPLLLYHDSKKPVGQTRFSKATAEGTPFDAVISSIDRPGVVKDRLDEAIDSLNAKPPLIRGVSIGFRPLEAPTYNKETDGYHFSSIEVLELSMVVIPAHQDATIALVKSLDIGLAVPGAVADDEVRPPSAGATALSPRPRRERSMKSISERVTALKAERKTIAEKMETLMQPVVNQTGDLSDEQQKEYDTHTEDLDQIDVELKRMEALERATVLKASPITVATADDAAAMRTSRVPRFEVKQNLPPGIEFTRYVICKAAARILGVSPLDVARERYPDNPRIQNVIKAAVAGATTTDATWAASLLQDVTTLTGEFLDYLRPRTIIGRFGEGGIPSLTRVPFYSRIQSQTSGGSANWVGQAVQKPVTKFDYDALTLTSAKVAAISVLSDELVRFSSPSAEARVRDSLTKIIVERLDRDFIDPDKTAVSNVSPASITSGITGLTPSSGGDAADVRTDVAALLGSFIGTNQDVSQLVWIMSGSSALQLMLMRNALGNREFPDVTVNGGSFEGFPIIVSQYAAVVGSPTQNIVVLVNASEIFLADDGGVTVDMSNEASIEMSDDPVNDTGTVVSMYQTNQVALRAERFINWARGRTSAVAWLDGVAWSAAA